MSDLFIRANALIASSSPESLTLEYKREPYAHTEGGRKEFSKDISAFANRDGGILIIGVLEKAEVLEVLGVPADQIDAEIQWLESVVRSGVSPHLFGVRIEAVEISGSSLIVIDIPRGFERPYEALQNGGRFFVREERSVRPMSREEIRSVVSNQLDLSQSIDRFVDQRWSTLCAGGGAARDQLQDDQGGCLLVVTPIFDQTFTYRVNLPAAFGQLPSLRAFHTRDTGSASPNIDGLRYPMLELPSGRFHAFTQIYRHGAVEMADGYTFDRTDDRPIPGLLLCQALIDSTLGAIKTSQQLTGASLYRVDFRARPLAGTPIAFYNSGWGEKKRADRDELHFDPIFIEVPDGWDQTFSHTMKPLLDAVWQAFGYVSCGYFNEQGEWAPPR